MEPHNSAFRARKRLTSILNASPTPVAWPPPYLAPSIPRRVDVLEVISLSLAYQQSFFGSILSLLFNLLSDLHLGHTCTHLSYSGS